ncbi:MAG: single-stranded DNA-binding protein [Ruminococcus sp.]|nr:single-stranded DNA-binding protein [Ruminococcus sp.]
MNKVILMGRLTADPELKQTPNGTASCRFTVAINRKYKNAQGGYDADFINCTAWRQTAEFICRYFKKGNMIMAEATLRNNNYQDKNHPDVTHYTMDVLVENVEFTGSKSENSSESKVQAFGGNPVPSGLEEHFEEIFSDDSPF